MWLWFLFGEVADSGEVFEVVVLRPEGRFFCESDGVDERVSEWEFVLDGEVSGGNRDFGVNLDNLGCEQ